jgi:hypothetical protein
MTYQELVTEIENLPLEEQLSLLQKLTHLVSRRTLNLAPPENSLERVRGLLKPTPDQAIPSDADLIDDYIDYL